MYVGGRGFRWIPQTLIMEDSISDHHHTLVTMYRNFPSSKTGLFSTFSFHRVGSVLSTSPGITHAQTQTKCEFQHTAIILQQI
jgi:hypothetical protein